MSSMRQRYHEVYRNLAPLDPDHDSIRLLTISPGVSGDKLQCQLSVIPLVSETSYEAISYTWVGDEMFHSININGEYHDFPVRANLFDLLLHLRYTKATRIVWIDAICINQDDLIERNRQVGIMRKIYGMAQLVVVWLGLASHKIVPAINFINYLAGDEMLKGVIPYFLPDAVLEMCKRTYWTRVWITQEVIAAREITVLCGRSALTWWRFEWAVNLLTQVKHKDLEPSEAVHLTNRVRRLIDHRKFQEHYGEISLEEALYRYEDSASTNFRDRIFGLLGIVQGQGFAVDYSVGRKELFVQTVNY